MGKGTNKGMEGVRDEQQKDTVTIPRAKGPGRNRPTGAQKEPQKLDYRETYNYYAEANSWEDMLTSFFSALPLPASVSHWPDQPEASQQTE